jgi:hypothetical protein
MTAFENNSNNKNNKQTHNKTNSLNHKLTVHCWKRHYACYKNSWLKSNKYKKMRQNTDFLGRQDSTVTTGHGKFKLSCRTNKIFIFKPRVALLLKHHEKEFIQAICKCIFSIYCNISAQIWANCLPFWYSITSKWLHIKYKNCCEIIGPDDGGSKNLWNVGQRELPAGCKAETMSPIRTDSDTADTRKGSA